MKCSVIAFATLTLVGGLSLAGDTATVSGTFSRSEVEDGTIGYLKIIDTTASCQDPGMGKGATMATFAEGKAAYTLEGVAHGSYTACGFIDAHAREGEVTPDSGDYGTMQPLEVEGDTVLDFPDAVWMQIP